MNILIKDWKNSKDTGLLILRVIVAFVVLYGHGFDKLSTIFSGQDIQFANPIGIGPELSYYLAALAEGICAILLILGLLSRLAAAVLTINFIVILIFHAFIIGDGFQVLELRFLYLTVFLSLTIAGTGKYSLDYLIFGE